MSHHKDIRLSLIHIYYDPKSYKLYYKDTGLLVASLDEESQENIRVNKNYGTYKGAIYENINKCMNSYITYLDMVIMTMGN